MIKKRKFGLLFALVCLAVLSMGRLPMEAWDGPPPEIRSYEPGQTASLDVNIVYYNSPKADVRYLYGPGGLVWTDDPEVEVAENGWSVTQTGYYVVPNATFYEHYLFDVQIPENAGSGEYRLIYNRCAGGGGEARFLVGGSPTPTPTPGPYPTPTPYSYPTPTPYTYPTPTAYPTPTPYSYPTPTAYPTPTPYSYPTPTTAPTATPGGTPTATPTECSAPKTWSTHLGVGTKSVPDDPANPTGPSHIEEDGRMIAPQDQRSEPFTPTDVVIQQGQPLACLVETATDLDKWDKCEDSDVSGEGTSYKWSCSEGGFAVGANADGTPQLEPTASGLSATYVAPAEVASADGQVTISCTIDDPHQGEDSGVEAPDEGSRNDEPITRSATITVVKVEMINPDGDPTQSAAEPPAEPGSGGEGGYSEFQADTDLENPDGDPTTDIGAEEDVNEFVFDASAAGYCHIRCEARLTPDTAATRDWAEQNVEWAIAPGITGSIMKWGQGRGEAFVEEDNKGREVTIQFKGLPETNDQFGLKVVTMTTPMENDTNNIQVFFDREAINHPGGNQTAPPRPGKLPSKRSPNWFYYWNQTPAGNPHALYSDSVIERGGIVPAMYHWRKDMTYSKQEIWIGPLVSRRFTRRDGSNQLVTGIDAFANVMNHEQHHVQQIADADAYLNSQLDALRVNGNPNGQLLIPDKSNTMWAKGWSWNWSGGNPNYGEFNHWTPGADGKPGIANYNDDYLRGNNVIDQLSTNGEFGEDRYQNGTQGICDDVLLDTNRNDLPDTWPLPPPGFQGHPAEYFAQQQENEAEHAHWQEDWGAAGKQHLLNRNYADGWKSGQYDLGVWLP